MVTLTIEITQDEAAAYEAIAKAEGLSVEAWLKKLASSQALETPPAPEDVTSKTLVELFEPLRGLDIDFERNPSTGRSVDL